MTLRTLSRMISLFSLLAATASGAQANGEGARMAPAMGTRGMVSSAHPVATRAGIDILARGGNAFDAAVAVASTLNVVEPQNSGIGGYGLTLIYDAETGRTRVLNSSGRIPEGVDADVFRESNPGYREARRGAKAISTPVNLDAWAKLSREYGTLPWEDLFANAIDAAENGHAVSGSVARTISGAYASFPEHAQAIYGPEGHPLREGDRLVQKHLADCLRLVAAMGPTAAYRGQLAEAIARTVAEQDGFLALSDLRRSEAEWWEPIELDYRGYRVVTCSPPANSFSSLMRLGLMERFDVAGLGHNTPAYLHLFAEATKHAYWCRLKYAGDPAVSRPPVGMLLSDAYLDEQAARLNRDRATDFVPPGFSASAGDNTTHFVVADAQGNIVSATQTLGNAFGSRIMVEEYGLWLNNSLYYCTFEPPGNPMDAHPGRRKLISNHPTIVFREGKPVIAIGTPGGHTIGQTVPQMVMNMLDFGMNVQEAIAAPRVSFVEPNQLAVEDALDKEVKEALAAMGHTLEERSGFGNAHGLTIGYGEDGAPNAFTGGSDPRGSGLARGL